MLVRIGQGVVDVGAYWARNGGCWCVLDKEWWMLVRIGQGVVDVGAYWTKSGGCWCVLDKEWWMLVCINFVLLLLSVIGC